LPSGNRGVGERSDTSGHQSTLLWSEAVFERNCKLTIIPPHPMAEYQMVCRRGISSRRYHQPVMRESPGVTWLSEMLEQAQYVTYSCLKDTKEESSDHDVSEVLGPNHDEDQDTPEESRTTKDSTGVESTKSVGPSGLSDHVTTLQRQQAASWRTEASLTCRK
jgi:hypothetical protein